MPARGALGSVIRLPADWLYSRLQGGNGAQGAVPAQFSYVELFNNATDGAYLFVYGITVQTLASAGAAPVAYQGRRGSGAVNQGMLQFDQPTGPGLLGLYTLPTCPGYEFGLLMSNSDQGAWPYMFPAAIIPPGYSMAMECDTLNTTMLVGYWWAAISIP